MPHAPGSVRDAIVDFVQLADSPVTVADISRAVERRVGPVPQSSVRSYLRLNTPRLFLRLDRGLYRWAGARAFAAPEASESVRVGEATLYRADAFEWLLSRAPNSIHAVVTDPPYGVVEYTPAQQIKLRAGRGGVWRVPPAYDGHQRAPLPRFTTLTPTDLVTLRGFFARFATASERVLVPGGNIIVASNPLLSHLVAAALEAGGLEVRGTVTRLVMTMRGGDRPKNAHEEFEGVSVLPRSMAEPWVIARKPLEGRVQDNLRKWGTGGWRRPSANKPFGDVVPSHPTSKRERSIAAHPSLKPQAFMRAIVRASLPLGRGTVLDPFAGSGSTLAAANAIGYQSIGVEVDETYFKLATEAIAGLASLEI